MKIFICFTYYHILVTLVKSFVNKEKYDIMIANDIPGYENLISHIAEKNYFRKIHIYDAKIIRIKKSNNVILYSLARNKYNILSRFKRYFDLDLSQYDDIYIYNDATEIGLYLNYRKIKYHLLEDALDFYKYFNTYYHLRDNSYNNKSFKSLLKKLLGIGFMAWGTSEYCLDIEVNDVNGIQIPTEKVITVSRKELFSHLSDTDKKSIYDVFASDRKVDSGKGDSVLICTQPLFSAGHVKSMEVQLMVFEEIIRDYYNQGNNIVIKPHPRDEADYSELVRKYHCGYIDKNIPSEVLDYNPNAKHYCAAISITSTSINALICADNKIFIGMAFVKQFEDALNHH